MAPRVPRGPPHPTLAIWWFGAPQFLIIHAFIFRVIDKTMKKLRIITNFSVFYSEKLKFRPKKFQFNSGCPVFAKTADFFVVPHARLHEFRYFFGLSFFLHFTMFSPDFPLNFLGFIFRRANPFSSTLSTKNSEIFRKILNFSRFIKPRG